MAKNQTHEHVILELISSAFRTVKTVPLNLGGLSGAGGGIGQPPGGFIGQLPQTKVSYDSTEAETLFTPLSGQSLLDNLNHIRYRINDLEENGASALIVDDWDGNPTITDVTEITFSGAVVTQLGTGHVLVEITAGSALTVEELDGNPSVNNVDKIVFSGATVTNLGGGDVLVAIAGGSGSFTGGAERVVLTDSGGNLTTEPWIVWNDSDESLEWGADEIGKTDDSGKIRYNKGEQYMDFFGAGSGIPRRLRFFEDVYVDNNLFVGGGQQIIAANQVTNGDSHDHLGGDGGQINHTSLLSIGTNTHAQIDTHIANTSNPHSVTAAQALAIPDTGWIAISATWTRTGNYTFTTSGDVTTIYRKGTKIRYKDGGAFEYGAIALSSHSGGTTTITLFVNDDFAMAAATITDKYISYIENPEGFPDWFNYANTIAYSANGSMTFDTVTTTYARFKVSSQTCFYEAWGTGTTGGTASTTLQASLPVDCLDATTFPGAGATRDATSGVGTVGACGVNGTLDLLFIRKQDNTNYGLGTGRFIQVSGFYQY